MGCLGKLLLLLLRLLLLVGLVYGLLAVAWNDLLTRPEVTVISLGAIPRPANARCGSPQQAFELIELPGTPGTLVVAAGGPQPISATDWPAFQPSLPWARNSTRHLLFDDSCFYGSPDLAAGPDACQGEDCIRYRTIEGYTWFELARVAWSDCHPSSLGCLGPLVLPGHVSLNVIHKCHHIRFTAQAHILETDRGDRFVMHATAGGPPDLTGPALPRGWSLTTETLAEPLDVAPQGDACHHFILRDNLGQGYHQFEFRDNLYQTGDSL